MKRTPVIVAAVVLVSAAVIVYHNALSAYFFDDDFQWLVGSFDLYFAAATPLFRGSPVLFHLALADWAFIRRVQEDPPYSSRRRRVAGITVRFALFAMANVTSFAARTQAYRNYTERFREIHGAVPSHTTVAPDPRLEVKLPCQFVNAAVQWHYRDPTIQVTPYEYAP